ncbi:MAG TPA: hypothetical protein VI056_10890 [Candidatus Limnocylindria bacterium]
MPSHVPHSNPLVRAVGGVVCGALADGEMGPDLCHANPQVVLKVTARVGLSPREIEALARSAAVEEVPHYRIAISRCRKVSADLTPIVTKDHGRRKSCRNRLPVTGVNGANERA